MGVSRNGDRSHSLPWGKVQHDGSGGGVPLRVIDDADPCAFYRIWSHNGPSLCLVERHVGDLFRTEQVTNSY